MEEGKLPTGTQDQLGAGDRSAGHPYPSLGTLTPQHTAAFSLHCLWGTDADGSQAIHPGFEKWQILDHCPKTRERTTPILTLWPETQPGMAALTSLGIRPVPWPRPYRGLSQD